MKYLWLFLCFPFTLFAETAVYFTPSLDCENQVIRLLDSAQNKIQIAVYSINNTQITQALLRAHERGIPIQILTDRTQASGKKASAPLLKKEGIDIKVHSKHRIEHNKFMVVDENTVITGSYNWTNPASLKNSENCLLVWNDADTVAKYVNRFEYLWLINSDKKSDDWFSRRGITSDEPEDNPEDVPEDIE